LDASTRCIRNHGAGHLHRALAPGQGTKVDNAESNFRAQIATVGVILVGLLAIIFVLPDGSDSDLAFSVVGLIITGALPISSQSIIANAMAGLMLRSVSSFRPGDFIEVAEQIGRVTERGLFHTEIQTADRDLVTLPNAIMVNQAVRVVRGSGTIVSATVSIGYDVSRDILEDLFVEAGQAAGLLEPFVQILDTLSEAGVEIMSPMYIARRSVGNDALLTDDDGPSIDSRFRRTAERRVFDKAEVAGKLEEARADLAETTENLELLRIELSRADEDTIEPVQSAVTRAERRAEMLGTRITRLAESQQED
jgi:small conductance mechanosensitive channel